MTIHKKIAQVLQRVAAVQKTVQNGQKTRSIDAVLEALHPEIEKANIYIYPSKIRDFSLTGRTSKTGNPVMQCTFIQEFCVVDADSGESITLEIPTEGVDATAGDKATAIARTYAFKAALTQMFFLVTKEYETEELKEALLPASVQAKQLPRPSPALQINTQSAATVPHIFKATTGPEKTWLSSVIKEALVAKNIDTENGNIKKVYLEIADKYTKEELPEKIAEAVEKLFSLTLQLA